MKRRNLFSAKIGIRLLFLSLSLFFFTANVNAQRHGGHLPFDSTSVGGDTTHFPPPPGDTVRPPHWPIDTTAGGWTWDTAHFPPPPGDTTHRPHRSTDTSGWGVDTNWHFPPIVPGDSIFWRGGDSTWAWGDTTGHNPPPPGDSTGWSGGDTTRHNPPPPGDSTGWSGGDTTRHNPPPPVDSTWAGGDSTGHNPPPPPGDSTWAGDTTGFGGGDSTGTCGGDTSGHGRPGIDIGGSIDGTTEAIQALVYPNPISSTAILSVKNSNGNVTFRMFDGSGRTVMVKTNLSNGNIQLNKQSLAPGLYFYEVVDNGTKTSGQIAIQ